MFVARGVEPETFDNPDNSLTAPSRRRDFCIPGGFAMSYSHGRALRVALAASAAAGFVMLGACSDGSSNTLTAPASPRAATSGSGGFGQAKTLTLCVSSSSPAGTYTFRNIALNRSIPQEGHSYTEPLDGNGFWDGTYWNDSGDGGDGFTAANASVGVDYTVTPGPSGCVVVLNRTVGDAAFMAKLPIAEGGTCDPATTSCGGINDRFAAANISYVSNTATAQYDHTDCTLDNGTLMPQHVNPTSGTPPVPIIAWPQGGYDGSAPFINYGCGASNSVTRGFVNYEHGATITYIFNSPVQSNGIIAPTATTCAEYAKGTASTLAEIDAGFRSTTIHNLSPGVFFYFATLTKGAGQSVAITQGISPNPGGLPQYVIQQTQAYLYTFNGSSCTTVATLALTNGGTTASGGTALPAGNYVLGVKYSTSAPGGTVVPSSSLTTSGSLLATHNFQVSVNGGAVATTSASVNTKAK